MSRPGCSIILSCYNCVSDLGDCLDALLRQDYIDYEIIVVDNGSTDPTPVLIASYEDHIRPVRLEVNRWVAGGYNAGAVIARKEILIFLNADTVAEPGWLAALAQPFADPTIGITNPCITLFDQPHLVNTCGNDITWTGLTVCRGLGDQAATWHQPSEIAAASGVALAIRRSLFEALGGFDEALAMYYEDTDLSLRARLAGYRIWYTPDSRIQHKYVSKFSAQKVFYLERNRWLCLFKTLRARTLCLLLPGLLLGEIIAWVFSAIQGKAHLRAKWESWRWLWKHRQQVRALRQQTQRLRQVPDRELLRWWSPRLCFIGTMPQWLAVIAGRLTYPVLWGYGAICRAVTVW